MLKRIAIAIHIRTEELLVRYPQAKELNIIITANYLAECMVPKT